jgi:hypothetical protein
MGLNLLGRNPKMARPSKYDPKYCDEIVEFFTVEPFTVTTETMEGKNFSKESTKMIPNKFPTFERFACNIDVDVDTLNNWAKEHEEFFGAYKKAKQLQKDFLMQNGLNGLYPAAAFCFVAKNCTDMRDKTEVEHSGKLDAPPSQFIVKVVGKGFDAAD